MSDLSAFAIAPEPDAPPPVMGPTALDLADRLRGQGDLEGADAAYRNLLLETPGQLGALLGLGRCAQQRGDNAAALEWFRTAAKFHPDIVWPAMHVADELRHLGRDEEAEQAYREALSLAGTGPARVQCLLGIGHCAQSRGDHDAALVHFRRASAADQENPWPKLYLGDELRALGRDEEAEAAYRLAAAQPDTRARALLALGHCARDRGDRAAALAAFQAAAEVDPDNVWPHIYCGNELRELGRHEEAAAAFDRGLSEPGPARLQATLGLGLCAQARADLPLALRHFQAAAELAPADPWPKLHIASVLRLLRRFEAAEATYRSVLEALPRSYHATVGLGEVARDRGDRETAVALFESGTEIDPDNPAAWLHLARELADRGDAASAQTISENLISHDPGNAQAWSSLAKAHQAAGRWQAAREALQKLAEVTPGQPDPWIEMAQCERRLGRPAAAAKCLEEALRIKPEQPRALEYLAELARTIRDFDQAISLYRRAIAAHPENAWPRIGLCHTLADLGRLDEALEGLDAAELRVPAADPAQPAIAGKRLELLRRAGHWTRARGLSDAAGKAWPRDFALWAQRFSIELLVGDTASIEACLQAAPAQTLEEQARVRQFHGQAAEARWELDAAAAHYTAALELSPNDDWKHQNIARVQLLRLDLTAARRHLDAMVRLDNEFATLLGRKPRVAWTHYGEILNEFAMDREALTALQSLRERPPAERIDPLLAVVRAFPDSTAAAVSLLIALRQSGKLVRAPAEARAMSPIPRSIAQYWDGASPPSDVAALMQTWRHWHPDHEIVLFDDAGALDYLTRRYTPDVVAAYRRARLPAQKADLFRLAWLFADGGVYVDCDDRCHAPLGSVMPADVTLALYQEHLGTLGNNVIGAVPQHPLIGRALGLAVAAVNGGGDETVWLSTGPGLLARAFAQTLAASRLGWPHWLAHVAVLDRSELYRAVGMHCFAAYKMTDRHWSLTGATANAARGDPRRGGAAGGVVNEA